jgi:hypothetical protein
MPTYGEKDCYVSGGGILGGEEIANPVAIIGAAMQRKIARSLMRMNTYALLLKDERSFIINSTANKW